MGRTGRRTGRFGTALAALVIAGGAAYYFLGDTLFVGGPLSYEKAVNRLNSRVSDVDWTEEIVQRRAKLQPGKGTDLASQLPDIGQFDLVVNPPRRSGDVVVEIFASTEKSGAGTDGWMAEVARDFNASNVTLDDGRKARVAIRKIASGTGYQFIASGKYVPQGFSPSNQLWVEMAGAHNVPVIEVRKRTVGNIAGVVMKTSVREDLEAKYGEVTIPNLIDAVVQGSMVMGYTNPFASSTGLNFLVTVLGTFSSGRSILAPEVVSAFEGFQRGVPFVALTTLQMRESVENDGSLDAFVMEYQTFAKTPALASGYDFLPFGARHDNPLYGVGELEPAQIEVLKRFAEFAEQPDHKSRAGRYGFNPSLDYEPKLRVPSGFDLIEAQKLWKEKKDAGRPIAAVFLADVSGSMRGSRLRQLKRALLEGSEFIAPGNSIGLVVFNTRVTTVLPVKEFNLSHKAAFHAAVQSLHADGNTAMYDGIAVALSMLVTERQRNPDVKPILFVLSDGQTNKGMKFEAMGPIIEGLGIPVYTIGYEADLAELARVSSLVEAASLNAGEGEIVYKIGSLLNAQM